MRLIFILTKKKGRGGGLFRVCLEVEQKLEDKVFQSCTGSHQGLSYSRDVVTEGSWHEERDSERWSSGTIYSIFNQIFITVEKFFDGLGPLVV